MLHLRLSTTDSSCTCAWPSKPQTFFTLLLHPPAYLHESPFCPHDTPLGMHAEVPS
jgi:hypothetical protein